MSLKGKTALSSTLFFAAVMSASVSLAAEKPAKLENIAGSELKRVTLTPKAAERLAIQTGEVREEPVNRWLSVEGQVEAVQTASLGSQPGATMSDAPPVQVAPWQMKEQITQTRHPKLPKRPQSSLNANE